MGRSTIIGFLLFIGANGFAQDFLIRYNNANTDQIPASGSTLDIKWDTGLDSSGTSITYNPATEEWNLADTGRYLIIYADQCGTTDETNNTRTNQVYLIDSAGTLIDIARGSSFLRKRNGAQEIMTHGYGVFYNGTTNTKLKLTAARADNVTNSTYFPSRIADRSGMCILKLKDDWNYARYQAGTNQAITTTEGDSTEVDWNTTWEEDSPFTLNANDIDIDIASNNVIMAVMSIGIFGGGTDQRTDLHGRIKIGSGPSKRVAWTYVRNGTESCDDGALSGAYVWDHTSGDDISVNVLVNEAGVSITGTNYIRSGSNLQLVELPTSVKWLAVEATDGEINSSGVFEFDWDTNPHIDTDQFTHSAGTAEITVDSADSYLFFGGLFDTDNYTAFRAVPSHVIEVNTTVQPHVGGAAYWRGSGTDCKGGLSIAGILPNLAANDDIYLSMDRLGTTGNSIQNDEGYFQVIKFSSLFPVGGGGPSMIINGVSDPAKVKGVTNPAKVNGI